HRDNFQGGRGGGVYINGGNPIVSNNIISGNYALGDRTVNSFGGGVFIESGTPLIVGNTISGNCTDFGGGLYAVGGLIRDNMISDNSAGPTYSGSGKAGGMTIGSGAVAVHNWVVGNYSALWGGGAACLGGTLLDNMFLENRGTLGW